MRCKAVFGLIVNAPRIRQNCANFLYSTALLAHSLSHEGAMLVGEMKQVRL